MKKFTKYILYLIFTLSGASSMSNHIEFSFWWWLGLVNVIFFGGYLITKLIKYLEE